MAKKFGKFLLFSAAVGAAAAAAYYYMKKDTSNPDITEDEDYDDFSEDLEDDSDASRNYVAIPMETPEAADASVETIADVVEAEIPASAEAPVDTITDVVEAEISTATENISEAVSESVTDTEEFFDADEEDEEDPTVEKFFDDED